MIQSSFILYILFTVLSFFVWKKYSDTRFFWFMVLSVVALIVYLWNYIAKNLIDLSIQMNLINFYTVTVLRVVLVLAALFVMFKDRFGKDK